MTRGGNHPGELEGKVDRDVCPPRYRDPVRVAAGGMGDLYRAVDEVLDRPVAIKVLAARFAGDPDVRRRFQREALAAARLSGESNTVAVFDVGEWRGSPYIVMEYLGGGTLEQVVRGGAQPPEQALEWLEQAARSLDAAHARGVIHRDVKPANLLLDERRTVHVGDFGIATAAGLDPVTLTGTVLGTAGYLAPEQAQGRPATAASDCYALAVVAYELLTGTRPFRHDSPAAEAMAHTSEPVPSAARRRQELPWAVDTVFETALAKDPAARFRSCAAFVSALRSACGEPGSTGTRDGGTFGSTAGTGRGEDGRATTRLLAASVPEPPTEVTRRRPQRRSPWVAAGAMLLLLAGGALGGALLASARTPARQAAATVVTTVTRRTTVTAPATTAATTTAPPPRPATSSGASELNTRGYRLMLAGHYSTALPLLRRAVSGLTDPANPVTAYANFNLGQTLVRLGRCSSAIPYLQRAVRLEPASHLAVEALRDAEQCAAPAAPAPVHDGPQSSPPGHEPGHHGKQGG